MNRRSSDGLITSRPSSSRGGGDRGTLTGIEEKTEEEGEMGEKTPLRNSIHMSDETIKMCEETLYQKENTHLGDDKLNKGLDSTQRDDSGIFQNESKKSTLLCDDQQAKDCVDLIDKLFSKLDDEPLKGGYPIDNHYTDGIISQITDCKYQDSAENDLNLHCKTNILIESGRQSKDCVLRPGNKDYTSVAESDIDLSALKCGNDTVGSVTPSQADNRESRLSKLYGVQTSDETLSVVEPSDDGKSVYDNVSDLTCPSWAEEEGKERPGLDHNELGLRNLRCSDGSEDKKVTTETEKQLAAAELSNAMKEKSPLREAASRMDSANNVDKDSCEGLDVKTKELWSAMEEDEERAGAGVVRGEFDCHRFSQSRDLRLWPDENDQWASPERRSQDVELRSEFFSGFSNKAWEVGERLVVGQEFWETEENDELAGSEPHPAILEGCEETWNDETQGHAVMKEKWDGDDQQAVRVVDVQQEENIENLGEIFNKDLQREISDIEVENIEIPEQESLEAAERQISSCAETDGDRGGLLDSAETEENQNFNRWPQNHLCEIQKEGQTSAEHIEKDSNLENCFSHTLESSNITICITEAPHENFSDLENVESSADSEEMRPWIAREYVEDRVSIMNEEEDYTDMPLPPNPISCPSDLDEIDQVDNFSSVDFPSPPPSIDLDVQDDKLESLDDSFPSPPPSVIEAEEFISHINLDDFIASTEETEPYISPTHNADVSEPPLQESPPATTQSKGISANLNVPSVHITLADESDPEPSIETQDDNLCQKTSSATPSSPQVPLNNLPELLISEWKDLDEEPLEDFEKLEQLCCISGDEEDDIFLGNLELLESLKKTPEQKGSSVGDAGEETPEGNRVDLKEERISDDADKLSESAPHVIVDPQEENNDGQKSPNQTPDVKDQGSFSKMTTKNGLMMQVSMFSGVLFVMLPV